MQAGEEPERIILDLFKVPPVFFTESAAFKFPPLLSRGNYYFPNETEYQYELRVRRFLLLMSDEQFNEVLRSTNQETDKTFFECVIKVQGDRGKKGKSKACTLF